MWHLYRFFLFFAQSVAFVIPGGEFVQTEVFYEPQTCELNRFNRHLKSEISKSLMHCGVRCFENLDCRRIMFDKNSKQCSMFETGENCLHHENEDKVCYRLKSLCSDLSCTRCPIGYYGDRCQHIIQDCGVGGRTNEVYLMSYIKPKDKVIEVKCILGMTFIQHRFADCLETDFNRTWDEYVHGFGNKHGEHWLGLQNIYDILQNHNNFEFTVLVKASPNSFQGYYRPFTLSDAADGFKFNFGSFSAHSVQTLPDALTNGTKGQPFSTYDRDYSSYYCPARFKVGWWFLNDPQCSKANPNGRRIDISDEAKIHWDDKYNNIYKIQLRLRRK